MFPRDDADCSRKFKLRGQNSGARINARRGWATPTLYRYGFGRIKLGKFVRLRGVDLEASSKHKRGVHGSASPQPVKQLVRLRMSLDTANDHGFCSQCDVAMRNSGVF